MRTIQGGDSLAGHSADGICTQSIRQAETGGSDATGAPGCTGDGGEAETAVRGADGGGSLPTSTCKVWIVGEGKR